ncbi:MAG: hypothetical protein ACD_79C00270G0007 [uncultured bacterium]|nr:MAG: hypothetical protein ACD_79C00270G0007 [uncultured bacterium]
MIKIIKGDILKQESEALVNTVNCVGVMGRGIALAFREAYPENYRLYKKSCDKKEVIPGRMFVYVSGDIFNTKYIINFPTKRHWKEKSHFEDIKSGLIDLANVIEKFAIKSITIPPLGCGLGGLDWKIVRPLIEDSLKHLTDVEINIIEPDSGFEITRKTSIDSDKNKLTSGRAALIVLTSKYLESMMDTNVSLLELHKLMYFLQESGEPLKLNYQKGMYGPYAVNLRHVLDIMNNIYIKGYDDREDNPEKEIELMEHALTKAEDYIKNNSKLLENIKKVTSLISGFETSFGMELLATVHWLINHENIRILDQIIPAVHNWNIRKRMFSENHIRFAFDRLIN